MQKHPDELYELENSPLGKCPPFLIINANNLVIKNDHIYLARKYSWGTCNIEDSNNSDFTLLHKLVLFFFSKSTKQLADCFNTDFMHDNIKKSELKLGIFGGVFLSVAAFGVWNVINRLK